MNISKATQTNQVLRVILFAFLVIVLRIWHLSTVQREDKLIEAKRPQERTLLVRADRGMICDRFGIPLAQNKICYNAAVYYNQISQVPAVAWQDGIRSTPRKDYIRSLAELLAKELELDPIFVEDQIHSRASLFPHVPYVLKSNLSEAEHYRLKMLEKDWMGIHAEISSERFYPLGPVACNILGRMGSISQKEYRQIAEEMAQLQERLFLGDDSEEVYQRLAELKEKAYTLNDLIGKTGVEGQFEEELRGFFGKKTFEVDQKGRYLRELPGGREAIAGKKLTLSISAELQQFAEELLAKDEARRNRPFWIKGGAIVALDPNTGEVLALASYPRFDPNDFIPSASGKKRKEKQRRVCRWLENERFVAAVWDGKETLLREGEEKRLTWELYLDLVLPPDSPAKAFFAKNPDLRASSQDPLIQDLCRLVVDPSRFSGELWARYGSMKLSEYRTLNQEFLRKEAEAREAAETDFHQTEFAAWREEHQKKFLAEKRKEEKEKKIYAKPYLDYLEQKEKEMFSAFWAEKRLAILSKEMGLPEELLKTFRSFAELDNLKPLAANFYPQSGFGFNRSYAFQVASPPGSWFKLITAYEGLKQGVHGFTIFDTSQADCIAKGLNGMVYPRMYKGGRLPRSHAPDLGRVDLAGAIEQTSNPYFSILAGDFLKDPEDLARAAHSFGLGEKTGIELPGEARGMVPTDLRTNRTGLYSTAIGQHTLLATPLQCATVFALIANGGHLLKPKIALELKGRSPAREPLTAFASSSYLAKEELGLLGIPFPLFTGAEERATSTEEEPEPTQFRRILDLPMSVRNQLLEGMDRVVWGSKGSARASGIRQLWADPIAMQGYLSLEHQMLGKTGTAELLCNPYRTAGSKQEMFKHVWFGAVAFPKATWTDPELVVVAMLRYGGGGKDAAPLAAKVIRKWREIQARVAKAPSERAASK